MKNDGGIFNKFLWIFQEDDGFCERLIMSDEAHFKFKTYINKQKKILSILTNDFYTLSMSVWYGISWVRIIVLYFSAASVTT
jgi:hypothetical protein